MSKGKMMFRLIPDAKRVVLISFSFWAQVIGVLLLLVPAALYLIAGIEFSPYLLGNLSLGFGCFGIYGRVLAQQGGLLKNHLIMIGVSIAIVLASMAVASAGDSKVRLQEPESPAIEKQALDMAIPILFGLEGMRNTAYRDVVGVLTICAGITRDVYVGEFRSDEQCAKDTKVEFVKYLRGWKSYLADETIDVRLPSHRYAAFGLFAYNVGIAGAGKSTATKRLNAGNVIGACEAMTWWNKAGGRVWRGLMKRRACESEMCLDGSVGSCPA
jgi:lysozyme